MTDSKATVPSAVIATGGVQLLVSVGQTVDMAFMADKKVGETVVFDQVLLKTTPLQIGQPLLTGASVSGTIVSHGKTKKVRGVKFHNKVRYRRTFGHRQNFTKVKIEAIA